MGWQHTSKLFGDWLLWCKRLITETVVYPLLFSKETAYRVCHRRGEAEERRLTGNAQSAAKEESHCIRVTGGSGFLFVEGAERSFGAMTIAPCAGSFLFRGNCHNVVQDIKIYS